MGTPWQTTNRTMGTPPQMTESAVGTLGHIRGNRGDTITNDKETVVTAKWRTERSGGENKGVHELHFIGLYPEPSQTFEPTDSKHLQQRTGIVVVMLLFPNHLFQTPITWR